MISFLPLNISSTSFLVSSQNEVDRSSCDFDIISFSNESLYLSDGELILQLFLIRVLCVIFGRRVKPVFMLKRCRGK